MDATPSWLWIAVMYLVISAAGFSVLWIFGRRAFRKDEERARPNRPRRSIMRVLEHRLEQLLLNPPQWGQLARRAVPYVLGFLGVVLGGFAVWALWSNAESWLSAPKVVRYSEPAVTYPFESVIEQLTNSALPATLDVIATFAAATCAMFGDGRRALLTVVPLLAVSGALRVLSAFDTPRALSAPQSQQSLSAKAATEDEESAAAKATVVDASESTGSQTEYPTEPEPAAMSSTPNDANRLVMKEDSTDSPPPTQHRASRPEDSHFGVDDALMIYGAYKLLTHENLPREAVQRSLAPTYTHAPGRVNAIRSSAVRAVPVFRSSRRRSR